MHWGLLGFATVTSIAIIVALVIARAGLGAAETAAAIVAAFAPFEGMLKIVGGVLLAIAAIAQSVFAFWTVRGAAHAREAARVALDQLEEVRRTSRHQLRAYIHISDMDMEAPTVGGDLSFRCTVRNSGQTPGLNVAHETALSLVAALGGVPFDDQEPLKPESVGEMSRAPLGAGTGVSTEIHHHAAFTAAEIAELNAGTKVFLFRALIHYDDVFGARHRTDVRAYSCHAVGKFQAFGADRHGNWMT